MSQFLNIFMTAKRLIDPSKEDLPSRGFEGAPLMIDAGLDS